MANFYIERIMAHGDQRSDAVVPFGKGLNIIQGYSDTGKTCIISASTLFLEVVKFLLTKAPATPK